MDDKYGFLFTFSSFRIVTRSCINICRSNLLKVIWFLRQNYTFREIAIRYDGHQLLRYDARLPRSVV